MLVQRSGSDEARERNEFEASGYGPPRRPQRGYHGKRDLKPKARVRRCVPDARVAGGSEGPLTLVGAARRRATSGRPRTACASRCSISWSMPMTIRSRTRACSICLPAPARSASRRSRAARRSRCSSTTAPRRGRCLRNNVEALGLGGVTKVYRRDAGDLGPAHPVEPFSLVFLDPPYRHEACREGAGVAARRQWLTPGALLVVEEAKAAGLPRRRVSRSSSGAPMTIPSSCFCGSIFGMRGLDARIHRSSQIFLASRWSAGQARQ